MPPDLALRSPRLTGSAEWRWKDDSRELLELGGVTYYAWVADVLDGLASGRSFDEHVTRLVAAREGKLGREKADQMVRQLLFGLHQAGHVDLDLGARPKSFAAGRYEVISELGRGGVGVAWLCRDASTHALVVVKHAWGYFSSTSVADTYLRKEADSMRELDDEQIVAALGSFEERGLFHLVRAYVDGAPLRLPAPDPLDLAARVGDIVARVHDRGHLLLDIKPGNFLSTPHGLMLIDVGLAARVTGGVARLERAVGTRGFVPPEVKRTLVADARSDVWILGRLLFALASGAMPREAWGEGELAQRLAARPDALAVVLALTQEAPEKRPQSMRDAVALIRSRRSA